MRVSITALAVRAGVVGMLIGNAVTLLELAIDCVVGCSFCACPAAAAASLSFLILSLSRSLSFATESTNLPTAADTRLTFCRRTLTDVKALCEYSMFVKKELRALVKKGRLILICICGWT